MKQKIIKILFISIFVISSTFASSSQASTSITKDATIKLKNDGSFQSVYGGVLTKTPAEVVAGIIQYVLSFLGVIFMILMIYAGFLWMTAAGESDKIKTSKDIFISAIIGLVIILSSYTITYFVLKNLTQITSGELST